MLDDNQKDAANFGRSQFKGKDDMGTHLHRWQVCGQSYTYNTLSLDLPLHDYVESHYVAVFFTFPLLLRHSCSLNGDICVDICRLIQFVALFLKGVYVLARRPAQLVLFLCLPSAFFLTFLIESAGGGSGSGTSGDALPTPLAGLGPCDTYANCIRVAFGPEDANTQRVMTTFSELNGLVYGTDVIPFPTVSLFVCMLT